MTLGGRAPFVKICCIGSLDEAHRAVGAGASAVGLVSAMPSGPGVITDERIAEIAGALPPPIASFLLTSRQTADSIIEQQRRCRATVLQLVDHVPLDELRRIRAELPGVKLVQVIHVLGPASVAEAREVAPWVDALLLDSGNPTLATKELGGTGRIHDWTVSRAIREAAGVPVFLAGGLRAENVRQAVAAVEPFGVDICSGVRTAGRLDSAKLERFVRAATGTTATG